MLDFTELSVNGQDLELLVREILFLKGYRVYWSGRGPDAGRDLLCHETHHSVFKGHEKVWLLQCKHNAHSGTSVSVNDLDSVIDSCSQHGADGYALICTTQPSSAVVSRLESIAQNQSNKIITAYWDAVIIEQILSTPRLWCLAQRFFPVSANIEPWKIYATESPNHWIANYKGYYLHLSNRIGSQVEHHLPSISARLKEIEDISLPKDHFIRLRGVYYDDKNGAYKWYMDYMLPNTSQNASDNILNVKEILEDGIPWNDGQFYFFDIIERYYSQISEHYDQDHYDYYVPYIDTMKWGGDRVCHKCEAVSVTQNDISDEWI